MTKTSRRYRITGEDNIAILHLPDGSRRMYWCNVGGGYVHEVSGDHPGTSGPQVCERLSRTGATLMWEPRQGPLADLIRREARALLRRDPDALTPDTIPDHIAAEVERDAQQRDEAMMRRVDAELMAEVVEER